MKRVKIPIKHFASFIDFIDYILNNKKRKIFKIFHNFTELSKDFQLSKAFLYSLLK